MPMLILRWVLLLLLITSAVLFALYAATGQTRLRRWGLLTLKWTLIAALGFFGVLILQRLA
jgi:hypothetical protein